MLESLPAQLQQMNIRAFQRFGIRLNLSIGQFLHLYRKNHPALADFKEIASHLAALVGNQNKRRREIIMSARKAPDLTNYFQQQSSLSSYRKLSQRSSD